MALALAGCGGDSGAPAGGGSLPPPPTSMAYTVIVTDVDGKALPDAVVSIRSGSDERLGKTDAAGSITLPDVPVGEATLAASAFGFEAVRYTVRVSATSTRTTVQLAAAGAWALGRPVVLATRVLDRAIDGTTLTVGADLAVVDGSSSPLLSLTAADFSVGTFDCSWMGPSGCISDAEGKATGSNSGQYQSDGPLLSMELQPPRMRRPYVIGLLLDHRDDGRYPPLRVAALKRYLTSRGGSDIAGIATVRTTDGEAKLSMLSDWSRDASQHLASLDRLEPPVRRGSAGPGVLLEMMRSTAEARDRLSPGATAFVVLIAENFDWTAADRDRLSALAREANVRLSAIAWSFGAMPELAMGTGGFVGEIDDDRQFQSMSGALDELLAGTTPSYRLTFRVKGEPGTFVAGGYARMYLEIRSPAAMPQRPATASINVAIP